MTLPDPTENRMGGFRQGSETSQQAAVDNFPRSGSQRFRVLMAIAASSKGATYAELAVLTGLGGGASGSAGKRVSELRRDGWVKSSGETRDTPLGSPSQVMIMTKAGRQELIRLGHLD